MQQPLVPGTSETSSTPHTLRQLLHFHHLRRINPLQDQLSNPVTLLDLKVCVGVVKQEDLDLSSILKNLSALIPREQLRQGSGEPEAYIGINNACTGIDEVLRRCVGHKYQLLPQTYRR